MLTPCYTKHAQARSQQRQIPPKVVDWLLEYGAVSYIEGAELWHFDKRAKHRLSQDLGRSVVQRLGKLLATYAVVKNGAIITTGYRYKRVKNA
jgi:hypothetical protein